MMRLMDTHSLSHAQVSRIQQAIRKQPGLDGWLFYDFRHLDPIAYRVLLLDPSLHVTRRWYYWVPAVGRPVKVQHRIEPHVLERLPGDLQLYVSWREQHAALKSLLQSAKRIAMQYSPMNAIPYLSRVDAGTIELIRGFGVEVVTSADLVQQFEAVWDESQLASHQVAAEGLRAIVDEAFGFVGASLAAGRALTEYGLQQYILSRMQAHGLVTSSPPIAAVNAHSADPHYGPLPEGSAPIRAGDLVLIDLWAKQPCAGAVYADITWTGFVGQTVPVRQQEIFQIVRRARDAAVGFVQGRVRDGVFPFGWEVDNVCRQVVCDAGYEKYFLHRTGHSIGEEVHGNGANIDSLETQDARRLLPGTCFSIEPGIYLRDEFGIRSELDVYLSACDAIVYGQPVQTELIAISPAAK
ncbi:Aminopeptidase YpdF (MP-, MA-, MS-, AP-, NP-specific) [Nitrospira defluvii]|uniref:Aminopeptidase YpdF (MP-, MA-, MS-, AP-, NP-specific) n=2 Tax=Nitrospira defluvii TaxID=330214 RepID=A0ABM8QP62_9BACT|nr:Aminopeptidase YpdF (MP-, MA-, MS-, AP-, NP-specific) [Nitrospira defluvii]